ncbi:hypothetical protein ACK4CS_15915 [Enterococcus gallinarum]|uniref:Uncharacterized protein n=1 Tax=Enterococcus gallinarum TaxID=1353 RepID=A0A376GVG3_ENTGA|nr:hypothetical protein [Enterococcus gallinarum]MDT2688077.1 hypothetical protein [Enterococcus gallinarum]OJG41352.1 hypothetical protein RV03_GL003185 [Enterococcus gallinarum]STD81963.1 Uncharacterised protein [Enterococcus gallinarum]STE01445.1 Uncharacterised protein [Enterococcus gallinarum]
MIDEKVFIKRVNGTLKIGNFYILDSIFLEYKKYDSTQLNIVLKYLSKSNLFLEDYICNSAVFGNLWNVINTRFEDIEEETKVIIYEKIKNIKTWNYSVEKDVISIVDKMTVKMNDRERIQQYLTYLKPFISLEFLNHRIKDDFFRCAHLVESIREEKSLFFVEEDNLIFDFTRESFNILVEAVKEQSDNWMVHDFSFLLEYTPVKLLTKIINDGTLRIEGSNEYPDGFLEIKIIQRIFVNVDLDEESLSEELIDRLNGFIDLKYKLYGEEMNRYVKKHGLKTKEKYIDGIGPINGGWVQTFPFVPVSPLTNDYQVEILVDLLDKIPDWSNNKVEGNFLKEQSIEGQNKEIIRNLNTLENWKENASYNEKFLEKLINKPVLLSKLTPSIVSMIDTAMENKYIDTRIAELFVEKLELKDTKKISYEEKQILQALVKRISDKDNMIFRVLFEDIKPHLLSTKSIFLNKDKSKFIELNDFINTDLGKYYSIIEEINEDILEYYVKTFLNEINLLQMPYREYLIGRNINYYMKNSTVFPTQNMFIGYCHRYVSREEEIMDLFAETAVSLLENEEFSDNFCMNNIISIMLYKICPTNNQITFDKNINYKKQINHSFLRILFENEHFDKERVVIDWIEYFLKNEVFVEQTASFFLLKLGESKKTIASKFTNLLQEASISKKVKMKEYEFAYIYQLNEYVEWQFKSLIEMIRILLKKSYIIINPSFIEGMVRIFSELSNKELIEDMEKFFIVLKPYLPISDYDYLQNKFPL